MIDFLPVKQEKGGISPALFLIFGSRLALRQVSYAWHPPLRSIVFRPTFDVFCGRCLCLEGALRAAVYISSSRRLRNSTPSLIHPEARRGRRPLNYSIESASQSTGGESLGSQPPRNTKPGLWMTGNPTCSILLLGFPWRIYLSRPVSLLSAGSTLLSRGL